MPANTLPHVIEVASLSELASVHVAPLDFGARAFVTSIDENFYLQPASPLPVDGTNVVSPIAQAIVGKPGAVWVKDAGSSVPFDVITLPQTAAVTQPVWYVEEFTAMIVL